MIKLIGRPRTPIKDRVLAKVVERPAPITHDALGRPLDGPCWIFTGHLTKQGYGVIWDPDRGKGGANRPAFQVTYTTMRGPIKNGELDHLCRVRACVSPWHLEDVGKAENGRRVGLVLELRKACGNGHPLTPENMRLERTPTGFAQRCKACTNTRTRRQHRAKAGIPLDRPVRGNSDTCQRGHPRSQYTESVRVHGVPKARCSECRRINNRRWKSARAAVRQGSPIGKF